VKLSKISDSRQFAHIMYIRMYVPLLYISSVDIYRRIILRVKEEKILETDVRGACPLLRLIRRFLAL